MKNLITILVALIVCLVALSAFGSTWYPTDQKTIIWDAVTTLSDGDPIPEGSTVEYKVYIKNEATGDESFIGQTSDIMYVVTLTDEGKYRVGVSSVRVVSGEIVSESIIQWSSDPTVCLYGEDFGIQYYIPLASVGGLRTQ